MGDIFKGDFQEKIDTIGEFNIFDENGLIEENRAGKFLFDKDNGILECFFSKNLFEDFPTITKITGLLKTGDYIYIDNPLIIKSESKGFLTFKFPSFYASETQFVCPNIEEVVIEKAIFPVKGLLTFVRGMGKKEGVLFESKLDSEEISLEILLDWTKMLSNRDKIVEKETRNAFFVLKKTHDSKKNLKKFNDNIIHIQNITNLLFTQNQSVRYIDFTTEDQEFVHIRKTNEYDLFHYPGITLKDNEKEFENILKKSLIAESFYFIKAYSFLSKNFYIHSKMNDMISDAMLMPEAYYELKNGTKKNVTYSQKIDTILEDVQVLYPYIKIDISNDLKRKMINTRNNIAHFNIKKNSPELSDIQEIYDFITFMNILYCLSIFAYFTSSEKLKREFYSEAYLIKGWNLKTLIKKINIKGLDIELS